MCLRLSSLSVTPLANLANRVSQKTWFNVTQRVTLKDDPKRSNGNKQQQGEQLEFLA